MAANIHHPPFETTAFNMGLFGSLHPHTHHNVMALLSVAIDHCLTSQDVYSWTSDFLAISWGGYQSGRQSAQPSLHQTTPDKTPKELFSGKKPSISHLKVFGSPVYVLTTKPSRSKLDPRAERCILLSFDSKAKAYRCYRPSTKKVFISRDVIADEVSSGCTFIDREDTATDFDTTPAPTRQEERLALTDREEQHDDALPPIADPAPVSPFRPSSPTLPTIDLSPQSHQDSPPSHTDSTHSSPPHVTAPRRSERVRRFPKHLQDFAAIVHLQPPTDALADFIPEAYEDAAEPLTFKQAHLNPHWRSAMQAEIDSIHSNRTWSLVPLPPDKKAISSKWVYKLKPGTPATPTRYKARLVARGFEQKDGVDFLETFAPVVRWETIRILIAIAVHLQWPIHQLDVLTAFLNGLS